MLVVNLASGSKGNETYVEAGQTKILVDAGLSLRETAARFALIGKKIADLDAILITHEHTDHIYGLGQIMKACDARVYAPKRCLNYLKLDPGLYERVSPIECYNFHINDVNVMPFALPHDSVDCYGYILEYKNKRVAFATDLGYMSEQVINLLYGTNLMFIESNHDKSMLLGCKYPYSLKQRIMSDHGHLSNNQAAEIILKMADRGTKHFVLSHISQNSNTAELAFLCSARVLEEAGYVLEQDVFLRYSRQDQPGNKFFFGEDNE